MSFSLHRLKILLNTYKYTSWQKVFLWPYTYAVYCLDFNFHHINIYIDLYVNYINLNISNKDYIDIYGLTGWELGYRSYAFEIQSLYSKIDIQTAEFNLGKTSNNDHLNLFSSLLHPADCFYSK